MLGEDFKAKSRIDMLGEVFKAKSSIDLLGKVVKAYSWINGLEMAEGQFLKAEFSISCLLSADSG